MTMLAGLMGLLIAVGSSDSPAAATDARSALFGSVAEGAATPEPLRLSLAEAIDRGLRNNLAALLADSALTAARGERWESLSDLLPHVAGRLAATRQKINLEAFGFSGFPGLPTVVGPFNVVDLRGGVTQTVFDLKALQDEKADAERVQAARYSAADARDLVILVCGNLYLQALAEEGRIDAAHVQVRTADALRTLAADRKSAGMVPAIDVLRADVELKTREQQAIVAEHQRARARLNLARAIGLPAGQEFILTDRLGATPPPALALDAALRMAYANRADWKSGEARVRAAEAERRAALGEALPTVDVNADYGAIGQTLGGARATFTLGTLLRVPLFEGGKAHGKALKAEAALQAERARLADLRGRIDYEVRTAALDLQAALDRVQLADSVAALAERQLVQAQDRFEAGVTSNIDVVQAQEAVAGAAESRIAALYDLSAAKAATARALGIASEAYKDMLRGE